MLDHTLVHQVRGAVPEGTTFRTILRHLSRVGRKDLVRRVGEWDDEPDEPVGESKATGLWG